jgi:hypothetical protein
MPALVTDARRQPSVIARRATSAMSGPGERVTSVAATVNAAIWPSMRGCYVCALGDAQPAGEPLGVASVPVEAAR